MSENNEARLIRAISDTVPPNGKIIIVVDAQRFRIGLPEAKEILEDLGKAVKEAEHGSACNSLPRWQCHKVVEAFKIDDIRKKVRNIVTDIEMLSGAVLLGFGYEVEVSGAYMQKHSPQLGGYYVRYEDGYESYSPAEAFESGYTRIDEGAGLFSAGVAAKFAVHQEIANEIARNLVDKTANHLKATPEFAKYGHIHHLPEFLEGQSIGLTVRNKINELISIVNEMRGC